MFRECPEFCFGGAAAPNFAVFGGGDGFEIWEFVGAGCAKFGESAFDLVVHVCGV